MPLMRGAKLSPRHILAAATPHVAAPVPASFFRLAQTPLPMFGNDQYGDCVTAEEYTAKAGDGHLGTDAEAINTAGKWGGLNGVDLSTILDYAAQGFAVGGQQLADGGKQTVNYTDWASLTSAIYQGQVKIAVAASQLQNAGAGRGTGWFLTDATRDPGIDHCIGVAGYGSLADCCAAIGVLISSAADASILCLIVETWGGYGIVSYSALLAIMNSTPQAGNSEAWLRVPTTVGPAPGPTPTPTPPATPTPGPCPWRQSDVEDFAHAITRGVARAFRSLS